MARAGEIKGEGNLQSVLIIDDHPLFCDALSMTLGAIPGIERIDTAGRLDTAMERIAAGQVPDIFVLDLNLPDVNGLTGLIRLRKAAGTLPIVVVSSLDEPRLMRAAIRAGATGFVPKHSPRDVFRLAFAAIARGETYLPPGTAADGEPDGSAQRDEAILRLAQLTRQQAAILELICAGRMNKQIAWDLSIAETTVKAHVTAIMRKLGVQTRTQAVLLAREASFSALSPDM